jgi:hypothetical protein
MRDFLVLLAHLMVTTVRLVKPGGLRTVLAESVLCRHQLLILNRGRQRAPNLRPLDRFLAGLCTLFIRRARIFRSAIVLRPSTLLHLHQMSTPVSEVDPVYLDASYYVLPDGAVEKPYTILL